MSKRTGSGFRLNLQNSDYSEKKNEWRSENKFKWLYRDANIANMKTEKQKQTKCASVYSRSGLKCAWNNRVKTQQWKNGEKVQHGTNYAEHTGDEVKVTTRKKINFFYQRETVFWMLEQSDLRMEGWRNESVVVLVGERKICTQLYRQWTISGTISDFTRKKTHNSVQDVENNTCGRRHNRDGRFLLNPGSRTVGAWTICTVKTAAGAVSRDMFVSKLYFTLRASPCEPAVARGHFWLAWVEWEELTS